MQFKLMTSGKTCGKVAFALNLLEIKSQELNKRSNKQEADLRGMTLHLRVDHLIQDKPRSLPKSTSFAGVQGGVEAQEIGLALSSELGQ